MSKTIMGIKLEHREESAPRFQELLTKHGSEINTRLGLHSAFADTNSPQGIILLEFQDGADSTVNKFESELHELGKVDIQKMVF